MLEEQKVEQNLTGPAHAVYFATYEAVKQRMGGNEGTEHHPLAAGKMKLVEARWSES